MDIFRFFFGLRSKFSQHTRLFFKKMLFRGTRNLSKGKKWEKLQGGSTSKYKNLPKLEKIKKTKKTGQKKQINQVVATPLHNHQQESHWASCNIDLPQLMKQEDLEKLLDSIDEKILRIKGCVKLEEYQGKYVYFERIMGKKIMIRDFPGRPAFGAKLIAIGPGSDPNNLVEILNKISK